MSSPIAADANGGEKDNAERQRAQRFGETRTARNRCPTYLSEAELGHAAAYGGSDDAELGHELIELAGFERLRAVGEGMVGIVVDFDEQAVGAGGHRGTSHGGNFVAASGAMRRVGEHGKV